ncbi:MAG TPA: DPP IV N-terminal domain-containing protein, partial [Chitinophagaceae bacterium]
MKKVLAACLLLLIHYGITAQDKMLSMEDAMLKARTTLAPQNLSQLQFYGSTTDYLYLKKLDGKDTWFKGNTKPAADSIFLTLDALNKKLQQSGLDTVKDMPAIKFAPGSWTMTVNGSKIALEPVLHTYKTIVSKELASKENMEAGNAGFIAYLDQFNLYVSDGRNAKQVTTDGSKDIVYASSVHRDEFGITKGTFWSNAGTQLAFYRMDQSMVTDYPIIDWSVRPAKVDLIKYPMAGDKSHHVTVGVYHTSTQSTVWLKTGEPAEQYLTNIAWSPDDKYIFIAV